MVVKLGQFRAFFGGIGAALAIYLGKLDAIVEDNLP